MTMIDWNCVWKDAFLASRLTNDNYYDHEERARSYDASESIWADGKKRAASLNADPSWSVLDIGSGPGILAVPLAHRVRRVTAIEPSLPMTRCLKKHLAEEKLSNVRIINSRWEDVSAGDLEAHDLVIASYSLNFEDIREALLKMNHLAKKRVILYWFAGTTNWEHIRMDLFPQIHGYELKNIPKCNVLYNLLYDLGLYPDIEVLQETSFPKEYLDYGKALFYLKSTLNVSDEDQDELLRKYIEDRWRRNDGSLFMDDKTIYAKISWRPERIGK
ncbi:MAG: class I SAM-dependent methyltransferase [Methanothrix sp.]|nr:MAG: class I SAM-dependent methyltransferase [Methanothrix sp.]